MRMGTPSMMKFQRRIFLISVATILPALSATDASADDASFCHDMPARQSVLEEGQQYLRQHGNDSAGVGFKRSLYPDLGTLDAPAMGGIKFKDISTYKLEHIPLDTPQQLDEAQRLAENLECAYHINSARNLYQRIFIRRAKLDKQDSRLAEALESVARTEILSACKISTAASDLFSGCNTGPMYDNYVIYSNINGKAVVLRAIQGCGANDKRLLHADALYSFAITVRRKVGDTHYLESDTLILAALKDRQGKVDRAGALYLDALRQDKNISI